MQVLLKSDGYPTYHLANVIDDHAMQISHVLRGEEWISSTSKHLMLYKAFNWDPPSYYHLPLLINTDKSKLSKRQNDLNIEHLISSGYLPQALVNFVAFLGWTPADNTQHYSTIHQLAGAFDTSHLHKSPGVVDMNKLIWFGKKQMHDIDVADRRGVDYAILYVQNDIAKRIELGTLPVNSKLLTRTRIERCVVACKTSSTTLADVCKTSYLWAPPDLSADEAVKLKQTVRSVPGVH